ncbi:MAG: hypothetical protein IT534_10450 [Bauldia sp.]|nr:hypothetical protein [Bauldia sp.]
MSRLALFPVTAIAAALIASSAPAQVSYRAVCQPGAGMTATVSAVGNVQITFLRGTTGAGAGGVPAGRCAWLDRGIGTGEPSNMVATGNQDFARYLANAVIAGSMFYVEMYNNGAGQMIVTRVGL